MVLPLSDRHNKNDNYETPAYIFDPLNKVFRFTLDVCAEKDNAKIINYISPKQDGLKTSWKDNRCWCNPPYSQVKKWVAKAHQEASQFNTTVVCLLPGRVDTKAWQDYVWTHAKAIVPMRGRITFVGCKDPAKFPSALAVFSPDPLSVEQMVALSKFGPIVKTIMRQADKCKKDSEEAATVWYRQKRWNQTSKFEEWLVNQK